MPSKLELLNNLTAAIRGEFFPIRTPSHINDDMWPTDHVILIEEHIYPLCGFVGADVVKANFEAALEQCSIDPLGLYCAHTCLYIQILNETNQKAAFKVDREALPKLLAARLKQMEPELKIWSNPQYKNPGDALRVIVSGMRILERDHGVHFA